MTLNGCMFMPSRTCLVAMNFVEMAICVEYLPAFPDELFSRNVFHVEPATIYEAVVDRFPVFFQNTMKLHVQHVQFPTFCSFGPLPVDLHVRNFGQHVIHHVHHHVQHLDIFAASCCKYMFTSMIVDPLPRAPQSARH